MFDKFESESHRLVDLKLTRPAYEYMLKCSHAFNTLDAKGAISVTQRANYIARIRGMAKNCAKLYLEKTYGTEEENANK